MKNQNIFVSVAIVLFAIVFAVWIGYRKVEAPVSTLPADTASDSLSGDKSFALVCDADKALTVTFHLPEDDSIDIMTSDGRTLSLGNTSSDTSASYTSADGKIVLSLSGTTLMLAENGATTYQNCILANDVGMETGA
jgi:membrane-bound inhibitor of C-type lysozyme